MSKAKRIRNTANIAVIEPTQTETNHTTHTKKSIRIIPRNVHQEEYLEQLLNPGKMIVLASGPAGTGKTVLAMLAGIKAFSEKKVSKIILCRPSVGVSDENLGFLPGSIEEKMAPWIQNLVEVLYEYYSAKDVEAMIMSKTIEVLPLMYLRGRNIKNSFVLLDEAQNTSVEQCKAVFTRLCDNSKLVVTGDNNQSDKKNGENGLLFFNHALNNFGGSEYISSVEFSNSDVQRHPVVKDVLDIFAAAGR